LYFILKFNILTTKDFRLLLRKTIIFLLLLLSLNAQEPSYELGKGLQVASLTIYIGGYFSLDYRNMNNKIDIELMI